MTPLYKKFLDHPQISTDSRRIAEGSIFFAIRGERFDGNRFALSALEQGAAYAVVDDFTLGDDERLIRVDDTLLALQELAREHREALGIPILAVAGSNGKTTTKELVSRVLAEGFRVVATEGNLNNHIGVPLTLLRMNSTTEMGVVEMGASACGEIARLCEIARPNAGILTNIGKSHLEGFGGHEGIRRGKGELYDFLCEHNGLAFVREEDTTLQEMAAKRERLDTLHYPTSLAEGIRHSLEGDYNLYNIAAAVAIGHHYGIAEERIRATIESYRPENMRSQRIATSRNTLIVDCYNANPTSMEVSILSFMNEPVAPHSRRILILGDMLELGRWSAEEHRRILEQIPYTTQPLEILLVGAEFDAAFKSLSQKPQNSVCFASCNDLLDALHNKRVDNALILIKGSHGIGLERAIEEL